MTLLFTEKTDIVPAAFRYNRPDNVPEVWKSVFTTPNGFMVATSERRSGKNKHSGKTYSKFQETKVEFFSMKRGVLDVYSKERDATHDERGRRKASKMGGVRLSTPRFLRGYGWNAENEKYYDIGAAHLGYDSMNAFVDKEFPLRKDFRADVPGISALLRHDNLTVMARSLMGKHFQKGVPRVLAQATGRYDVGQTRSRLLGLPMMFQGIVPTDWIVDIMQAGAGGGVDHVFHTRDELRIVRRILKTASETQLRRLTRNPTDAFSVLLRDTIDLITTFEGLEFRDLDELHNTVAPRVHRAAKAQERDRPLELDKKAEKFVGEADGFTIIAPEKTSDLYGWSETMGNCISGFGNKVAQGQSRLFAVMQENKMVANIELDPSGTVKQLLGQYNAHLDEELSAAVKGRILTVWPKAKVDGGWQ